MWCVVASHLLLSFPSGVRSRPPAGSRLAGSPPSPPSDPPGSPPGPPHSPPASDGGPDGPSEASPCRDCSAPGESPSPGRSPRACTNSLGHFWTASIDHCGLEGCSASFCEVPECLLVWPCVCMPRFSGPLAGPCRPRLRCGCEHIDDDSVLQRCLNAATPHGHLCSNCNQGSACVCLCRGCVDHDYSTERGWAATRLRGGGPRGHPVDSDAGDPSLAFPPLLFLSVSSLPILLTFFPQVY